MQATPQLANTLELLLKRECRLYADYFELLEEEGKWLINFNAENVTALTMKRAELYEDMRAAQQERIEIMKGFRESIGLNLRGLVRKHFSPQDAKRLIPLCEQLHGLVTKTQKRGREHFQILNFGLKVVHGIVSIIWSATQSVLRSYNRQGGVQKSYHPSKSRLSGVLKQA